MTGEGLSELRGLKKLASLSSSSSSERSVFTDAGFKELGTLTQLTHLWLSVDVSEVGVAELSKLVNLTTLDLWSARIAEGGWKQLQSSLPNCEVRKPFKFVKN